MITLAIETSTAQGCVALLDESQTLFSETFAATRGHSSGLFTSLQRALAIARPHTIAVGLGPGSYSGVRIAISAAIGLSLGTGASLAGIPSVAAFDAEEYVAIGDARRGAFYFSHVREGELLEGPRLLDRQPMKEALSRTNLPVFASEPLDFARVEMRFPFAEKIAQLAIAERSVVSRGALEPIYLRDALITTGRASLHPLSS